MASLFISYSRKDIDVARKLTEAFPGQDLDYWIDWEGIEPTVDWWREIEKGIEQADNFLFLLSPDSIRSKVCEAEIAHAVKNGKRLIPVVVREVTASVVTPELRTLNWIFFREGDDFTNSFGKLITAVKTDYAWVQAHRRLQVKALEWERGNKDNSFLLRGKDLEEAQAQLVTNAGKNPNPTHLQTEYVLNSRRVTDRQRRLITTIAIAGTIIMAALAVFGFVQANRAAERATVARAGELAAQSVSVRGTQFDLALLLSIEAVRTNASPRTESVLLDNTQTNRQLLQYLFGHTGPVFTVAFSPDGKILASGSEDHTIILWDVATRQPMGQPLTHHTGMVSSLAFSPDGKTLVSGSREIILWDLTARQPIGEPLPAPGEGVNSLAFSPDGRILASGTTDDTIILWDLDTHRPIGQPLIGHTDWVNSVAFSPDGKTLASGSDDHKIILWDVSTALNTSLASRQPIGEPLTGHTNRVNSVAFSPDGKTLASSDWDKTIILWDVAARQPIGEPLTGHTDRVNSVAFSPDSKTLASASYDGTILLWDVSSALDTSVETRQPLGGPFTGHASLVLSLAFSPDGKILASGSDDHTIILWDVSTALNTSLASRQPIGQSLTGHTGLVESIAFSPDGKILASGSDDHTIILWDVAARQPIGEPLTGHTGFVESIAFSPDGKTLASGSYDTTIILWDVASRRPIGQPFTGHASLVQSLAFSPDGKTLASSAYDNNIILWDLVSRQPIAEPLTGHTGLVKSLAFSPDGKTLASGSDDGTIILWDVAAGQPIGEPLTGHASLVLSVAFSPDGKTLASGSYDTTILLWDVSTALNTSLASRQPIDQPLTSLAGGVHSLAFSPDGKTLASGHEDQKVILWDVAARQPIGEPLTGHTGLVKSVAFSPDGKTLASGSYDTTIMLWEVSPQHWIEQSCQRVSRNYTSAEWERYFPNETYRKTCEQLPKDSSYYQTIAEKAISESTEAQRVQKALLGVRSEMEMDSSIEDSAIESSRIVREVIVREISREINAGRWQEALDLSEQAKANNLAIDLLLDDENILNKLCWGGSVQGYASQVLEYCVQAVKLVPNDPSIRDSRGLARALTGDYSGAIEDFQFFIENADDEIYVQQRQQWIMDLGEGKNPFTPELLELLKEQ